MPVPPEDLDRIAATTAAVYREAEAALVALIAKHLAGDLSNPDMTAPAWAEKKLAAIRDLRRAAEAVVAGLTAASEGAFRDAAAEAFRAGWNSALAELPQAWFPKSGIGQAAEQAAEEVPQFAAIEALAAAVHGDIGRKSRNILRGVLDVYRAVIGAATARTVTGVQTRRQAAQAAWAGFMRRGITGFTDRAGRRWQLSTYVEMATRTVTQRAAVQGQTTRLSAMGVQLVYASNAPQECALCRPYEGRVLRLDAGPIGRTQVQHAIRDELVTVDVVATLDDARAAGFQHPNCRHSVSAYLPGVTKLPAQPTADPEGDEARQKQRALERDIRAAKIAEAGALDEQARKDARRKTAAAQAKLREHLAAHPQLKRLRYREQIGAGNIPGPGGPGPAGAIGPATQPTLDGGPGSAPQPRPEPAEAVPQVDRNQLDLLALATKVTDAVVAGRRAPADLSADELLLVDQELAARAAALGEPDHVTRTHRAVRAEIKRRGSAPPPDPLAGRAPEPEPQPAPEPEPVGVLAGDFSALRRVGPQGGSNPGGLYEDADGVRWYVKSQRSEEHARNEVAAAALYRAAGLGAPEVHLGQGTPDLPEGWHTASRVIEGTPAGSADAIRDQVRAGFGVDAWVANWDVVGLKFDNVVITPDDQAVRIDLGGSLLFRAQGDPKGADFGDTVDEWLTLRNKTRAPQAVKVFAGMTPVELLAAVNRVNRVKVGQVREIIAAAGLPPAVAERLIARRRDLIRRLPALREQARRERAWLKAHKASAQGRAGLTTPPLQLTYATRRLEPRPEGWLTSQLQRVASAVSNYRGSGYTEINGALRRGDAGGYLASTVAAIDEAMAISQLPKAVGVHRGIREPTRVFGASWNDVDVTGLEWEEKGYSSTTVDPRVAESFAAGGGGRLMMRVVLPPGTRALRLSDMAASNQPLQGIKTEAEVLVTRATRYRVVADHGTDEHGTRHLDVEVVPNDQPGQPGPAAVDP